MYSASKCIHSALMKYFYYALKVAIFQSPELSEPNLFFPSLNGVIDMLFNS